jgi:hypothetical protein
LTLTRSKHYAFIEFADSSTAEIAAKTYVYIELPVLSMFTYAKADSKTTEWIPTCSLGTY